MAATIARSIMAVRSTGATASLILPRRLLSSTVSDYKRWLIFMDKPGGEDATKQQMIDCSIQTLAKVLGSEEEAKRKIYNVSCERYFRFGCRFGCEIDEETSNKLEALPGVLFVLPDSYFEAPKSKTTEMNRTRGRRVTVSARSKVDVDAGNGRWCGGGGSASG